MKKLENKVAIITGGAESIGKTTAQIDQAIVNITSRIHNEYPELCKYLREIPVNISGLNKAGIDSNSLLEYYNSLKEMLLNYSKTHKTDKMTNENPSDKFAYEASEDIYNKGIEKENIDPENISKNKTPNAKTGTWNEKDFKEDNSGNDLDIPGAELDDQQENIGSEDEENNYYSLGGDAHNDLDEN